MKIKLKEIQKIAQSVRKWAEEYRQNSGTFYTRDLCGLCAIASAKLHKALAKQGIKSTLHLAETNFEAHVFVVVDDYVVDVTATQFGVRKKVVVLPKNKAKKHFWKTTRIFKTTRGLIARQKKDGWCDSQTALN